MTVRLVWDILIKGIFGAFSIENIELFLRKFQEIVPAFEKMGTFTYRRKQIPAFMSDEI